MSRFPHFVLPLVLLASTALARMNVEVAEAPPTSDVVVSNVAVTGWSTIWKSTDITTSGLLDIGQSFEAPSSFTLDTVTIRVRTGGTVGSAVPGARVYMDLLTLDDPETDGTPNSVVFRAEGRMPWSLSLGDYLTFDVPDSALTSGQAYLFMLRFVESDPNRLINIERNKGSSNSPTIPDGFDGAAFVTDERRRYNSPGPYPDNSYSFWLQEVPSSPPVSEGTVIKLLRE